MCLDRLERQNLHLWHVHAQHGYIWIPVWVGTPTMVTSLGMKGTRIQSPCNILLEHSTCQVSCMDPTVREMQCIRRCTFQAKILTAQSAWKKHAQDK